MVEVRFISEAELPAFRDALNFGFGGDASQDEDAVERFLSIFHAETSIAGFDEGAMVATFGSFDLDLSVPGGSVPMAGTTVVTVHPPYRRQGLLSKMMRMHLDQAIERGQPVAGLWASETQIYGRYGYGAAAYCHDLTVPGDRVELARGPDSISIRFIDHDEAAIVLPPLYSAAVAARPGMFERSDTWWATRRLSLATEGSNGYSSRRIVVARDQGEPVGYAIYRQKDDEMDPLPSGETLVVEAIATTDDARRALWHYLTNIDLFPNVRWHFAPVDEPLMLEADSPRAITAKPIDTLWVRILDVVAALAARTYESDGDLVIGVRDRFLVGDGSPLGYRLSVADGAATCEPTDEAPEVEMDISVLGSLYLGDRRADQFARAGRITGSAEAVALLDRVLGTSLAPWCGEVF